MKIIRDFITNVNFTDKNDLSRIKYIVIHYFGSLSNARNLGIYWKNTFAAASAHYGVDYNGDIYQYVEDEDIAWHCGANYYKHPECRNSNSIGIEMAVRKRSIKTLNATDTDWYFEDATVKSTIELVKMLMKKYNIPADHVIRHYDVTGKICPNPFVYDTGSTTWAKFKYEISSAEIQNEEKSDQRFQGTAGLIWTCFDMLGLSDVAKAAFLGNLEAESGLRSNNVQDSFTMFTDEGYTQSVDERKRTKDQFVHDGVGYGLAQWTFWSRKKAMYEFVFEKLGRSIGDINAQITFMMHELRTLFPSLLSKLEKCETVREASDLILKEYEAPAVQTESVKKKRSEYSMQYYNKFSKEVTEGCQNPVFLVKVEIPDLRIRTGPGTNYIPNELYTGKGVFTIVDMKMGAGSDAGWGLLKSYEKNQDGWISLDFVKALIA